MIFQILLLFGYGIASLFASSVFCQHPTLQKPLPEDAAIDRYFSYLHSAPNFGPLGDWKNHEMQIVDDLASVLRIQEKYCQEFLQRGYSQSAAEEFSRIGIIAEDRYWIWVRDPILLPNGQTTAYNRFCPKNGLEGQSGVAVLVITKQKQALVNLIYRHATRAWEIELPRGGRDEKETPEMAALRELKEETGILGKTAQRIGAVACDSGILTSRVELYLVDEFVEKEHEREECEAIEGCFFIPIDQLKKALAEGFLEVQTKRGVKRAHCRDSFLASALYISEIRSLL